MPKNSFDILAIGDIVIDAFVRLKDAEVHCEIDTEKCQICMPFKEKIPYEFVKVVPAVGNSPNAAVSASRLGLRVALYSNIGNDKNGKDCIETIEREGIDSNFIKVNEGLSTNYHYVLWFESDRTILVKHEAYQYELPDLGEPSWIYLSSLGENSLNLHNDLLAYIENHPKIKLAFQPGTFQMKFGKDALKGIYEKTSVFIGNKEEVEKILQKGQSEIKQLAKWMHEIGPKVVLITDGPKGAYLSNEKGMWFVPPYPDEKPPYERTGAGDAFASTFVSALALGKDEEEALVWSAVNSMSVVQYIGAQEGLLTQEKIKEYLSKTPDFKAKKLS